MLGWISILKKKFEKMPAIAQFVIAMLIIMVIRYLLHLIIYSNYLSGYLENFGNPSSMVYFHMDGCGYCKKFNPIWDKFVSSYGGELKVKKVERKEAGDMLEKYNIQGFPTILLLDDKGGKKEFSGDRTVVGLESFSKK
jgi:thiol-disulfide isomerase/thioredoxin